MTARVPERDNTVAIFDLDGTITRSDTYVRFLLAFLRRHPTRVLRACWLPLAVAMYWTGTRDNTWLKTAFLKTIAGGSTRIAVEAVVTRLVPSLLHNAIRARAIEAIENHRRRGHRLVLATASLDIYVDSLGRALGFDDIVRTRAAWDDRGRLSGALDGGNCHGERKRAAVAALLGKRDGLFLVSYSDHEADLPLLDWSDRAAVVNPDERLAAQADAKTYDILNW